MCQEVGFCGQELCPVTYIPERCGKKSDDQFSCAPLLQERQMLVCSPVLCYNSFTKEMFITPLRGAGKPGRQTASFLFWSTQCASLEGRCGKNPEMP